ncbi:unnamed protein product [Durusdinium trenchii]
MIPEACKTLSISSGTHLGSFLERLRAWTLSSEERLRRAESKVLEGTKCKVHVTDVPVKDGSIHTLSISPSSSGRAPVVLVHGYFMGSASWAHSFDALASSGRNVYAIDWPSWGLSSRSSFPAGQGIDACEQFFVDGIESWRKSVGLERVVLLGHSFGGYFAACYTMKYPQHVEKLILASPVGMMGKQPDAGFSEDRLKSLPWWQRFLFYRIKSMWEGGWTPMDFVRVLGPLGLWLTDWYMDRRFRHARELGTMQLDSSAFAQYLHALARRSPGSERCLGALLDFGAWAKHPVAPRLVEQLQREVGEVPVTLLYGDTDWMDARAGAWLVRELGKSYPTEMLVIENAGHQMFLDNPLAFDAACRRALELRGSSLQLFAEHSMLRMFLGISLCCLLVKPLTASSIVKDQSNRLMRAVEADGNVHLPL